MEDLAALYRGLLAAEARESARKARMLATESTLMQGVSMRPSGAAGAAFLPSHQAPSRTLAAGPENARPDAGEVYVIENVGASQ